MSSEVDSEREWREGLKEGDAVVTALSAFGSSQMSESAVNRATKKRVKIGRETYDRTTGGEVGAYRYGVLLKPGGVEHERLRVVAEERERSRQAEEKSEAARKRIAAMLRKLDAHGLASVERAAKDALGTQECFRVLGLENDQ